MTAAGQEPLLFFWTGHFMYIGNGVDTIVHNHHAIQIAISFDDAIEIVLPEATARLKAYVIDSDQEHACRTQEIKNSPLPFPSESFRILSSI